MNNRLIILAVAVTCTAQAPKPVAINTNTAGELADVCAAKQGQPAAATKRTFCQGFAQGAINVELRHAGQDKPFCFPKPAPTRAETMQQFVAWVGALPERRLLASTDGLFQFLKGRYPCAAKSPTGSETSQPAEPAKQPK